VKFEFCIATNKAHQNPSPNKNEFSRNKQINSPNKNEFMERQFHIPMDALVTHLIITEKGWSKSRDGSTQVEH